MATVTCLPQVVVEVAWDLCTLSRFSCGRLHKHLGDCFACSWCLGCVSNLGVWLPANTQLQTFVSPHLSAAAYHLVCRNKSSLTSLQWFCYFLSRLHIAHRINHVITVLEGWSPTCHVPSELTRDSTFPIQSV